MIAKGTKPEDWNVKFIHGGEKNIYSLFSIPNRFLSDAVISCCSLSQPVTLLIPSSKNHCSWWCIYLTFLLGWCQTGSIFPSNTWTGEVPIKPPPFWTKKIKANRMKLQRSLEWNSKTNVTQHWAVYSHKVHSWL